MILFRKFRLNSLLNSISCRSVYSAGLNLASMYSRCSIAIMYTVKNSRNMLLFLLTSIFVRKARRFRQRVDSPFEICCQTDQYYSGIMSLVMVSEKLLPFFPLIMNPNLKPVSVSTY